MTTTVCVKRPEKSRVIILDAIGIGGLFAVFVGDPNISTEQRGARQLEDSFVCHVQKATDSSAASSGTGWAIMPLSVMLAASIIQP